MSFYIFLYGISFKKSRKGMTFSVKLQMKTVKIVKEEKNFLVQPTEIKGTRQRSLISNEKSPSIFRLKGFAKKRRLPTLPRVCSTIGAGRLNFSVRNGKRWNPATITT